MERKKEGGPSKKRDGRKRREGRKGKEYILKGGSRGYNSKEKR